MPGGDDGIRTHDPLLAGQVLSQLSYTPIGVCMFFVFQRSEEFDNPSKLNNKRRVLFRISSSLVINSTLSYARTYWFMPVLHRKEVIQPHLPIRLPCYDLTPIIGPTFDSCLQKVSSLASGVPNFHGLTGGVYKARERIHRGMLIRDY